MAQTVTLDLSVYEENSLAVVTPQTDSGREWIAENVGLDGVTTFGADSIPVEIRYIMPLLSGALADGITVEKDGQEMYENSGGDLCLRPITEVKATDNQSPILLAGAFWDCECTGDDVQSRYSYIHNSECDKGTVAFMRHGELSRRAKRDFSRVAAFPSLPSLSFFVI